jgi:hypothetical protein
LKRITNPADSAPGGSAKGYTFDACIHPLGAGSSLSRCNAFWKEVDVLPCEMATTREVASAVTPKGTYLPVAFKLRRYFQGKPVARRICK